MVLLKSVSKSNLALWLELYFLWTPWGLKLLRPHNEGQTSLDSIKGTRKKSSSYGYFRAR